MANRLDHFMWASADLDRAIAEFERLSGVRAGIGGVHPGRGTRNALASLGPDVYLEILAPDPAQKLDGNTGAKLAALASPRIYAIVAAGRDLPAVRAAYEAAGVTADVSEGGRMTPTGAQLRWRILNPRPNAFGAFAPLFIDWLDTPHPAATATPGCRLVRFEAGHPDRERIAGLWRALGLDTPVVGCDRPFFMADVATPRGLVRLTSAGE